MNDASPAICRHYYVSGKVQGVFFRAHACSEAEHLGVTGWVRNLPDGRVEVMALGTAAQLDAFAAWLAIGSPLAKVAAVESETVAWQSFDRFKIL